MEYMSEFITELENDIWKRNMFYISPTIIYVWYGRFGRQALKDCDDTNTRGFSSSGLVVKCQTTENGKATYSNNIGDTRVQTICLDQIKERFKNECNVQALCPGCKYQNKYIKIFKHMKVCTVLYNTKNPH